MLNILFLVVITPVTLSLFLLYHFTERERKLSIKEIKKNNNINSDLYTPKNVYIHPALCTRTNQCRIEIIQVCSHSQRDYVADILWSGDIIMCMLTLKNRNSFRESPIRTT